MGQSSHDEVVLFHLGDPPPTQPPLAAGLGKCVFIIHDEAFKMGVGGFNEIDF